MALPIQRSTFVFLLSSFLFLYFVLGITLESIFVPWDLFPLETRPVSGFSRYWNDFFEVGWGALLLDGPFFVLAALFAGRMIYSDEPKDRIIKRTILLNSVYALSFFLFLIGLGIFWPSSEYGGYDALRLASFAFFYLVRLGLEFFPQGKAAQKMAPPLNA